MSKVLSFSLRDLNLVFILGCFLGTAAQSAEIKIHKSPIGSKHIVLSGDIENGDFNQLNEMLTKNDIELIELDSNGGSALEAMKMGKFIRQKGLETVVQHKCLSACNFIFLCGDKRYVFRNAIIGQHQGSYGSGVKLSPIDLISYNKTVEKYYHELLAPKDNNIWSFNCGDKWFELGKKREFSYVRSKVYHEIPLDSGDVPEKLTELLITDMDAQMYCLEPID